MFDLYAFFTTTVQQRFIDKVCVDTHCDIPNKTEGSNSNCIGKDRGECVHARTHTHTHIYTYTQ